MSRTVCLLVSALHYPEGGGKLWLYLNWALGLRALGCEIVWLELVPDRLDEARLRANLRTLKEQLERHGLSCPLALGCKSGASVPASIAAECLSMAVAVESELLLDFQYDTPAELVRQFRTTALVDIDPGLLQIWQSRGTMNFAPHDFYFSIGESVGRPGALFPDCDWGDLQRLQEAGISIQSHSASHRSFSIIDATAQEEELVRSKTTLEQGLVRPVQAFAYPFGDGGTDPERSEALLQRAGYRCAFLYGGGTITVEALRRYRLPRIAMGPDTDLIKLLAE